MKSWLGGADVWPNGSGLNLPSISYDSKSTMKIIQCILACTSIIALCGCMTTGFDPDAQPDRSEEYVRAGTVTVEMDVWNILFLKSPAERRNELLQAADDKAKREYGDEAVVANHIIESVWSPFSLVLGLDLVGFVEHGTLHADVLLPAPPPPPPPPPEPEPEPAKVVEISYPILPQERVDDDYGYIALEYLTRGEVLEKIKARLDKREADADDYEREYAKVPEGGHLLIHIGRQDLMHANTLWYGFEISTGTKILVKSGGKEGIPNIKGRDGNWWNIVTVPLKHPIDESISVLIYDEKIEATYEFSVTRVETVM